MRLLLRALSVILLFAFLILLAMMIIPIHVYDGFESAHPSRFLWLRRGFEPGSVISQTAVVRSVTALSPSQRKNSMRNVSGSM
jgi:hypothetical protein